MINCQASTRIRILAGNDGQIKFYDSFSTTSLWDSVVLTSFSQVKENMRHHLERALLGRHPVEAGGATTANEYAAGRRIDRNLAKSIPKENINVQSG